VSSVGWPDSPKKDIQDSVDIELDKWRKERVEFTKGSFKKYKIQKSLRNYPERAEAWRFN